MTKMTVAKALRYKKRVASKIAKLEQDIVANNSILEGGEREVDIATAIAKREDAVRHLIDVKLAISTVSAPIQRMILECAEAKSRIAFLSRVPTQNGKTTDKWSESITNYEAELRKAEVDRKVSELEDFIDEHQTKIDAFNNSNHVEFADLV